MKYEDELRKLSNMNSQQGSSPTDQIQNRVSRVLKIAFIIPIIITAIVGITIFFFMQNIEEFGMDIARQLGADEEDIQQTTEFAQNPAAFDPVAGLQEAQTYAGEDVVLTEIMSYFVSPDGTQNFAADYSPPARTTYNFYKLVPPPENAPPSGVDNYYQEIIIEAYNPGERRHVTSRGGNINLEYYLTNKGFIKSLRSATTSNPGEPLESPRCGYDQIWQKAIAEGAPENATANITYDEDGYRFQITAAGIWLDFDHDCNLTRNMSRDQ